VPTHGNWLLSSNSQIEFQMASTPSTPGGFDTVELGRTNNQLQDVHFQASTPMVPLYPPTGSQTPRVVDYSKVQGSNRNVGQKGYPGEPLYDGLPDSPDGNGNSRHSNWDVYSRIKKIEHSYEEFDTRNAAEPHLAYADGDIPKTKVYKFLLPPPKLCLTLS